MCVIPTTRMGRTDRQKYDWTSQDWGIMMEIQYILVPCRLTSLSLAVSLRTTKFKVYKFYTVLALR